MKIYGIGLRFALRKPTVTALFMLCFIGLFGTAHAQTLVSLDQAIRNIAVGIEDKLEKDARIIILDVNTTSKRLSDYIIDELAASVTASGKLIVLDRKNLDLIKEEMKFQLSGEVSDESMQSIGQKLGAQSIIAGIGEDIGDYYRVRFRTLEVVSARVQSLLTENIDKADLQFGRLTQGQSFLNTKRFAFGAALGAGFGVYSLGDIKNDYSDTSLTSQTAFLISLRGAYNVNSLFAVQTELNVMINNGVTVKGVDDALYRDGYKDEAENVYRPTLEQSKINNAVTYTSLDIPILARFNFRPTTALLISALVGPYVSFPMGDLKSESRYPSFPILNGNRADKITNATFGVSAGVTVGYNMGPGYITVDARFLNDFNPITADYQGKSDVEMFTRRVIVVAAGYELWF